MTHLFSPESGLTKSLTFIADLMLLNLLYMICCIPIVTAGAASAALYSVTLKLVRGTESGIVKPFFTAFRENFRNATLSFLLFALISVLVYLGIRIIYLNPETFPSFFMVVYGIIFFLLQITAAWTWPLLAKFSNTLTGTLKNALLLGFAHPFVSLAAVVLNLLIPGLALLIPYWFLLLSAVWILFGFSGIASINSLMFNRVFETLIHEN